MATFDSDGLVIDRLADIKAAIQTDLRSVYGDGINLAETSPFGILVGIISERYFLLWEKVEAIYEASFPNTSFGVYLDEISALNGIVRDAATSSVVNLTFTRSNGISDGDVTVPAGTQVSATGSSIIWTTDAELTIPDLSMSAITQATASETGPIGALSGTLVNMVAIPTDVASVTNATDATVGRNAETDSELKLRRQTQLGRSGTATEQGIRSALINLASVRTASVIENATDAVDADGRPAHSFEAYVALESGFNLGMVATLVFDIDFVTGNSCEAFVDGDSLGSISFDTDQATTIGLLSDLYATSDLLISATDDGDKTITIRGLVNYDFTADTIVTLGASQPTDTFTEVSPADTTTMDEIAQTLWDSKAAGIQSYGGFIADATDSVGNPQVVNFSEVTEIPIYIRFTLTTTAEYDSGVGEPAIQEAIIDWSLSNLITGADVILYKVLCAASDVGVEGIEYMVVEISTTGTSGPWSAVNLTVDPNEVATIESGNIVFV